MHPWRYKAHTRTNEVPSYHGYGRTLDCNMPNLFGYHRRSVNRHVWQYHKLSVLAPLCSEKTPASNRCSYNNIERTAVVSFDTFALIHIAPKLDS